ncbi:7 transmembrane sweet-taste receptor of 3 GCPR-domain-containing protein [Absidia repens]|uniref:7 transmembrane sweet-taste receptor of 3 GCPR-domain-containing protein n=1 Tax=Absidia repens TaxID=90262 RepID=A0A1X2IFY2_9FUNG|nr:7 transmembrane sweet-taste receptor of 3 GCPR-domain-containing protein [Absidia repens]
MMAMAEGFHNIVKNSTNTTFTLNQLAYRQLGAELSPSAFNTSFVGPEGPINLDQNGDMSTGNYRIYNIQNGENVNIGNIVAGKLKITSSPIYHDGTANVPTGVPPKISLNPGYSTPLSIILVTVSAIGTLLAVISICLVIIYRKREVFRMASPLFCVLELIGFILCYTSVLFFIGDKSKLSCIVVPVALNLGWSLVLGNLIAKNYRIYHVFNNIFITRTLVENRQLLKVSGSIMLIEMVTLVLWLCLCNPQTFMVPMPGNSYYIDCLYNGPSDAFVVFLTLIAACELAFAAFLAYKTRSVGKNYSKYSEYKQLALSVYNIIFSALIGVVAFFLPTTDYYTQHYLVATMVVWATTFCLFTMFLPKFLRFRKPAQDTYQVKNKASDLPGRQQSTILSEDAKDGPNYQHGKQHIHQQSFGELLSMNGVLNGENTQQKHHQNSYFNCLNHHHPQYQLHHRQLYHRTCIASASSPKSSKEPQKKSAILDAYEAQMPMQRVLKYMPFLSSWNMQQIVLMPRMSYFSYFSDYTRKGNVFGYTHATIVSSSKEAYVLKIHGLRFHNILIQVANQDDLQRWYNWFNSKPGATTSPALHRRQQKTSTYLSFLTGSRTSSTSHALSNTPLGRVLSPTPLNKPMLDSGMTTRHLLVSDDGESGTRQNGSCITLVTIDSQDKLQAGTDTVMGGTVAELLPSTTTSRTRHDLNPSQTTVTNSSHQNESFLRTPELHATGLRSSPSYTSTSSRNTPLSEGCTMVGTPCMNDEDDIMMYDL